jgi:serine/threonine protein kinase
MGEVYLAEDPRLRRKVAIKVLPSTHVLDAARKARFLNEARAASSLNHPNIVTIFDVGREGETDYLVMEYVEGRSLRQLLQKRRLELREATDIAAQMASGLAAAHAKGIVHRDIKPENVMIGADGTAKILDYGVAKLLDRTDPDAATSEHRSVTSPGSIVGTVAYMSPEQVQAQEIDHRSDIFSLGIVLWEMLSGGNPFAASTLTGIVQRIVTSPPPAEAIAATAPPRLREILLRTLALRPADRYQSARDLELDLRTALNPAPVERSVTAAEKKRPSIAVIVALACVVAAMMGALADRFLRPTVRDVPPRLTFTPLTSDSGYEGEPTFSPDGQTIAYVSDRAGNFDIFLKQISGGSEISLTSDAADDVQPAFSPDGKQIAFVSTRTSETPLLYRNPSIDAMGGDIWVMSALGGTPRRIVENGNFPAWSPDGSSIVFVRGGWSAQRIFRVAASGGEAEAIPVTFAKQPLFLTTPQYSPDGQWISFSTHQPSNVCVISARGGSPNVIAEGRQAAWKRGAENALVYSDLVPGHSSSLSLIQIDGSGKAAGESVPITSGRGSDRNPALARDGRTVVFASQSISFNIERIAFDGVAGKTVGQPESITRGGDFNPFFNVAPDERAVVFQSLHGVRMTLWRQELGNGVLTQLAGDDNAASTQPEWSPDGKQIAFTRGGEAWVMSSDGANPHKVAVNSGFVAWTPDSRSLSFFDFDKRDVRVIDLATKQVRVVANEGTIRTWQKFSPDGKWMLYMAIGKAGVSEVRVVALGSLKSRVLVSNAHENGHPFFSPDLQWVYFQPDHKNVYRIPGPAQEWKSAPPQQVTFFPESNLYLEEPQLSADGKHLYYSRRSAASDLWVGKFGS